jgi:tetratricopeptide (TPR) repeat protein
MVGVARVGDLVAFWALLGVVAAIYGVGQATMARSLTPDPPVRSKRHYYRLGSAAVLVVFILAIFVVRDVQMLRSGFIASDAFEESRSGDQVKAIRSLQRAADISPDVEQYRVWGGKLLLGESRAQVDPDNAVDLLSGAPDTFLEYLERDSLAFTSQLNIGLIEAELVNLGDGELRSDLIARSIKLADSMAAYPLVQAFASERVLIAGQLDLGLELADRAIAMEEATSSQPLAWFMRGNALGDLGDTEAALEAFMTALDREPGGLLAPAIHRNMALAYDSIGDADLAAQHRERAEEIESSLER